MFAWLLMFSIIDGSVSVSFNQLGSVHKHSLITKTLFSAKSTTKHYHIHVKSNYPHFIEYHNPIISIAELGGDFHGINDSTSAFEKAINLALTYGSPNHNMTGSVKDLGGVTIDLEGGDYIISNTLKIPQFYGNIKIIDGTIRASMTNFSISNNSNTYLVMIGNLGNDCNGYNCNQNILFENIMLDCQHIIDGALYINHCMGCVIGPGIIIHGFNKYGITVQYSHGTLITSAWIGEYWWSQSNYNNFSKVQSTGIYLETPDSYLTDLIVFSSRFGIVISGVNNYLDGIHTWNFNEYLSPNGTLSVSGITVNANAHSTRIINSYLDWVNLVIYDPHSITVQDCFFLGGASIVLSAMNSNVTIQSVIIMNNQYSSGSYNNYTDTIIIEETQTNYFESIVNTYIENAIIDPSIKYNKYYKKSTKAMQTLTNYDSTQWIFNFSHNLLFENIKIEWIDYSFQLLNSEKETVQHNALAIKDKLVVIQTNVKCDGKVYLSVDQSIAL